MPLPSRLTAGILLIAGSATAAQSPANLVQPTEGRRGLVLAAGPGQAQIEHPDGRSQRITLRRDEQLTEMVETWAGWVAAGTRGAGEHRELVVLGQQEEGIQRLAVPPDQSGLMRLRPILLTEWDRLVGMVWLEGNDYDGLAVHAADWDGHAWSAPTRVSPAGAGNQTGLTGLVLANGTWLLVWSQFDGHDDELFWSLRHGTTWSDPKKLDLDNRAPDISPHLARHSRGALLAWSRYDGSDYRLLLARFRGGRWRAPEPQGAPGLLEPRFARREDQTYLIYRTAWPSDWTVAKISSEGGLAHQAVFPEAPAGRPVLRTAGQGGATLRWPSIRRRIEAPWERVP